MQHDITEKQRQALAKYQFQKGVSGNPKGRTPGAKSQITKDVKTLLGEAAKQNLSQVNKALEKLLTSDDPVIYQRGIELYTRLLEFTMPRLSASATKIESESTSTVLIVGKPADLEIPFDEDQETHNTYPEDMSE